MSDSNRVRLAVVGAGARARVYSRYLSEHPDEATIEAVADPNTDRREAFARDYDVPPERQFQSHEDIVARPDIADAALNCTMDRLHVPIGLPLVEAGFHMLMEKPISPIEREVRDLADAVEANERIVMIGHVLRYAPFYMLVKRLLDEGRIGEIMALHTQENVAYWHMAVAFVTGKYNRRDTSSPMLMAKCCHDLDLVSWFMSGVPIRRVSSFGSLSHFRLENAPEGAGERCVVDCEIERNCPYSAGRLYLDNDYGWGGPWSEFTNPDELTLEQKRESLATDNPNGRCVWHSDNNVVDHQSVIVEFANGVTATHDMWGNAARPRRKVHIMGTEGEIEGDLSDGVVIVRTFNPDAEGGYEQEEKDIREIDPNAVGGHGGGDLRLMGDFLARIRGDSTSRACTRLEDSLAGHLICFAAERAMTEDRVIRIGTESADMVPIG